MWFYHTLAERDFDEWYSEVYGETPKMLSEDVWVYGFPEDKPFFWSACFGSMEKDVELSMTYDHNHLMTSWYTYLASNPEKFIEILEEVRHENPELAEEIVNHPEYHVWEGCAGHVRALCAGKLTSTHQEDNNPPYSTRIKDFPQETAIKILKLLIESGLDLSIKNAYSETAQ